jgi:hypothetical protein
MIKLFLRYSAFFYSIIIGLLGWCLIYAFLPVESIEPIKLKTISFIGLNYLALIIGFISFSFKIKNDVNHDKLSFVRLIKITMIIIGISYVLRWIDLFYLRDLSFFNNLKYNRVLNNLNFKKSNFVFILASIIKSIYFLPFVLAFVLKIKLISKLGLISCLFLVLPLIEAALLATRKPLLEVAIIVVICFLLFRKSPINKKSITVFLSGILIVLTLSTVFLFSRETKGEESKDIYEHLLTANYNEILKPKSQVVAYFESENHNDLLKFYSFTIMHTGQYFIHGVYEFNHIIEADSLPITNGANTFFIVPKLLNKTKLFNKIDYSNPSPRGSVYLTAFGGLFIDFRWLTIIVMFFMGVIQKYVYQKSKQSIIYIPILIYFLIINVFLLILNYMRGAGTYPFIGFVILLIILKLVRKIIHEKSISS